MIVQPIKMEKIDQLKLAVFKDRKAMGKAAGIAAAKRIRELLAKQEKVRIVFASAPSQNEFLEQLRKEAGIEWSRITAFHMDEYIGLPKDSPQLFSRYIDEHLFSFVNPGEVHFIDSSNSISDECVRYTKLISQAPIDMVCLGIGENGHIAFNDPPVADFYDPEVIKPVELDEMCRQQQVNDGCFPEINQVPTQALTLTIPALLSGSYLYCIVPGKTKFEAVQSTLYDSISAACPASYLRRHPNCMLFADQDAYGAQS
ncbi:glucosamine-6-phosphate deaminase [Mesobacillus harenae]|uniref:glucosamine-6-phosphate deaminase n=1 Tax=Mesobacillus harenae TaxID=2213203 RepID=UPI0030D0EC62